MSLGPIIGEQTLHSVEGVRFGVFRCPPSDWRWQESNPVGDEHYLVFPHRSVVIEPEDGQEVIATAAHLVVYDAGGRFRRRQLDPEGDWCTFLAVEPNLMPGPRTRLGVTPVLTARGFALQGALVRHLAGAPEPGPLADSAVLALLDVAVAAEVAAGTGTTRHQRLAWDAAALLGSAGGSRRPLPELAQELAVSTYHLARIFRRCTGYSLHDFRRQLRLRAALAELPDRPRDLAGLAADQGFAHHSHFTKAFREAFGTVPSHHTGEHLPETLWRLIEA